MTRPFGIKKRKRKHREEQYDKEDPEELASVNEEDGEGAEAETATEDDHNIAEDAAEDLPGLPIVVREDHKSKSGVIFILDRASLEVAKVGKTYQILNSDDHQTFLKRNNKDPAHYRPDITHQALLTILDSPINKAGRLKAVYVKTEKGVLFEVNPKVRIPRTYKRFAGLMSNLLQKLSITASGQREKLLRVIKNPVTQYLPLNSRKIGFSHSSEKLVKIQDYVKTVQDDVNLVFMVGALSHGKIEEQSADDYISISEHQLSAAWCIAKIAEAMAHKWNIV